MKIQNNINELNINISSNIIRDSLETINFSKISSTILDPEIAKYIN